MEKKGGDKNRLKKRHIIFEQPPKIKLLLTMLRSHINLWQKNRKWF